MVKSKLRILCFGEAMVELSSLDLSKKITGIGFAGDTLNTAIYLKRVLDEGAQVDYLTVLGQDLFSNHLTKYIESELVGTHLIRRTDSRNVGLYAINIDSSGEREFAYWRDRSAARLLFNCEQDFSNLNEYDLIYFSGISLAILPEKIRNKLFNFLENNVRSFQVAFDSNYRPNLWQNGKLAQLNVNRAFNCCDIALPSLDDQKRLLNLVTEAEVVGWFNKNQINQTILKRGANGPRLIGKIDENCNFVSKSRVVDSTAAGDSFNAGFLAAYFSGKSASVSARHGHELAKVVISHAGAICPKEEVNGVIKTL